MNRYLTYLIFGLVAVGNCRLVDAAIPMVHVGIDVRPEASGGNVKSKAKAEKGQENQTTNFTTDKYDSSRTHESGITLGIDARNTGTEPVRVRVEWVFFAEPANGKGDVHPHSKGGQDLSLIAAGNQHLTADSGSVKRMTKKNMTVKTGSNSGSVETKATVEKSGDILRGWYVRLLMDGRTVQVRASAPAFEKLGQTDK